MEWILIALVPAFVWSFAALCDKILVSRFVADGITAGILTNLFSAILIIALLPFAPIRELPLNVLLLLLLTGAIWGWNRISFVKGISLDEATRVVSIGNMSPVIILLGSAILFGEVLKPADFLAFVLIFAGVMWISIRKTKGVFHWSPALLWMFISASLFAIMTMLLKYAGMDDWWSALFWINMGFTIGSLPFLAFGPYLSNVKKAFSKSALPLISMLFLINILTLAGRAGYFIALQLGPAAIVSVLASLQTALVFILALVLSI